MKNIKKIKYKNKDKKILLLVLSFGLVLILLGILGYFLSKSKKIEILENKTEIKEVTITPSPKTNNNVSVKNNKPVVVKAENPEIKNILEKTKQLLEIKESQYAIQKEITFDENGMISWTNSEEVFIVIEKSPTVDLKIIFDRSYNPDQFISNETSLLDKIFLENGYKKNLMNTIADNDYGDSSVGYEKVDIKCELYVSRGNSYFSNHEYRNSISITCSDKYQENYNSQIKILKDLNIKNNVLDLSRSNISGRYAFFSLGHGAIIAMMDANDKWNTLYKGLDPPPCKIVIENKVPKEITKSCYPDGESTNTIPNPNK